jgi:uncharacterized protein (TIGR03437 family)
MTGSKPTASGGKYTGLITLSGNGATVRVPYLFLAGSSVAYNVNPISEATYGYPGQDGGQFIVQVVDTNGVPVVGAKVQFTSTTRSAITMQSYGNGEPACVPASSTTTVTCPTDQFGFAYVDTIMGSQTNTDDTVNGSAQGLTFTLDAYTLDPTTLPAITAAGVTNGATYKTTPIAPGSYVQITGQNLLDENNLSGYSYYNNLDYDLATGPGLPLALDYTSVTFDVPSAGLSLPGYVSFVSPTQVNAWIPWELQGQSSVQMKVTVDESYYGNVVTIPLAGYAPSFFVYGLPSSAIADALDLNYHLISTSNPAVPGQIIQLYCNGLGPVNSPPLDGAAVSGINSTTTTTPVVTIGGQQAAVQFSGLAPGFVGLYQVNVTVPAGLSAGNQPITIAIGGTTSPTSVNGAAVNIPVK